MQRDEIFEMVKGHIYEVLPDLEGQPINWEDRLTDLGANSVDRAEVAMLAMESLSLQMARVELAGVQNISDLVDALHSKSNA
ncbi:acyl carrier protein [Streptomyces albus]|uniref:acyl carrier protein n=1 Tax=Streptomyces albus TaxID=1888 RepID=UPI0004C4C3D6|nr:acyl carrier protein [Streptomyces albus]